MYVQYTACAGADAAAISIFKRQKTQAEKENGMYRRWLLHLKGSTKVPYVVKHFSSR